VILSSDGRILTNNHVISDASNGDASIAVTFADGSSANARVLGADPTHDLAMIAAQGRTGLKAAALGDSRSVAVGQSVVAIGSPEGLAGTVTSGIVSATGRKVSVSSDTPGMRGNRLPFGDGGASQSVTIADAIQTDASINPGNSGGPLLNLRGQVIGINFAITTGSSGDGQGGSVGLGFTIPINDAKSFASQYLTGSVSG
jgi:putative serine protease PepD